uniref:RNase H type-1 domain-containing protein n=1 Tax=Fagus sylvatica TaxID=28930 RepID=A0A2N9IJ29_FAGSY
MPAEGWVKINVDVALGDSHSSLAMVVRDWRGTGVLAISQKANTSIPLQAEAEALLWAAQVASEQGLAQVCFESDSKICIDALHGNLV